jgi:hypothetical protein
MFCRSLCVLLFIFFWLLCCLFFFDIRILITPLVSSNSSYQISCLYFKMSLRRPVLLGRQELGTLAEHLSVSTVFSGVQFPVLWFVDHCLSFFFWLLYCLFFEIWLPSAYSLWFCLNFSQDLLVRTHHQITVSDWLNLQYYWYYY